METTEACEPEIVLVREWCEWRERERVSASPARSGDCIDACACWGRGFAIWFERP